MLFDHDALENVRNAFFLVGRFARSSKQTGRRLCPTVVYQQIGSIA